MTTIVPAILADSAESYKYQVERLHGLTDRAHIDITDGEFAQSFTVSVSQVWWPQEWSVDIHAMVARPSEYLDTLVNLKPSMVILHAEVAEDIVPVMKHLQKFDIKAGLALLKTTVPSTVKEAIEEADHVMIFTGNLGYYGGSASLMQLEKVRLIRAIRPTVEIGWDGGANLDNAYSLAQGGVDVVNVGGALASAVDIQEMYKKLVNEVNKQGVI
jgi:ribulose-phosphate 3-epimerase